MANLQTIYTVTIRWCKVPFWCSNIMHDVELPEINRETCAGCAVKSNGDCTLPGSRASAGAGRPRSLPSPCFAAAGLEPSR